tara:strand:- start:532 stop:1437 length:906 start_codon:yes stop_codon:yes gene_type:complete
LQIPGTDQVGFLLWTGAGFTTINFTATGITDGTWHHICATVDDTNGVEIFVDGASVGTSGSVLNQTADTVHPYTVGGFVAGFASFFFDGNIEEPAVFGGTTKFDLAEAQELYNTGTPNDLTGHSRSGDLIAWWRMGDDPLDDATGGSGNIQDQIGTNHGTPMNTESGDIVSDVPTSGDESSSSSSSSSTEASFTSSSSSQSDESSSSSSSSTFVSETSSSQSGSSRTSDSSESFFSSTSSQSSSSSSTEAGESSSSSSSSIDDFEDATTYYTVIDVDNSTGRNHHLECTLEKLESSQDLPL